MKIKDIASENRPRERLIYQGVSVLSDAEQKRNQGGLPQNILIKRVEGGDEEQEEVIFRPG